jgi:hypothetical protein
MIHILPWAFIYPDHPWIYVTFTILDHPEACPTGASHRACPCGAFHPPVSDVSWWAPHEPLLVKMGHRPWQGQPDSKVCRVWWDHQPGSVLKNEEMHIQSYNLITSKRMNTFFGCKDVGKTWKDYVFAPNWFIQYKIHTCITVVDII